MGAQCDFPDLVVILTCSKFCPEFNKIIQHYSEKKETKKINETMHCIFINITIQLLTSPVMKC